MESKPKKKAPEPLPCKCGDIAITLRPRGGKWTCACLNPKCSAVVRGFATEKQAVEAWNKEVQAREN